MGLPPAQMTPPDNIDDREISSFEGHAADWWDRKGRLKALHDINPLRLSYVAERAVLSGKEVLDIGCGGGIFSEAMARAGARVTGIDRASSALSAARAHMKASGLSIRYRQSTAEALAELMPGRFDVIVCMELLEHVPDPRSILAACSRLAKQGGDVFFSTINRTWISGLLVIFMAERILNVVKKGTHQYRKLIQPAELAGWAKDAGFSVAGSSGFLYLPFPGRAWLTRRKPMNYMMHLKKNKFG
jgi:2-polyprenyl-6-hydroxyphenyl methylase/3-demethylubiquinone-9 3-methyltransferase